MSTDVPRPDIKARLAGADSVVDALPWWVGTSEAQRKRARGRVSALAHQVAALLAGGWGPRRDPGRSGRGAGRGRGAGHGSAGTAVALGVETGQTPRPADPRPGAEHRAKLITPDREQIAAITGRRSTVRYAATPPEVPLKNLR